MVRPSVALSEIEGNLAAIQAAHDAGFARQTEDGGVYRPGSAYIAETIAVAPARTDKDGNHRPESVVFRSKGGHGAKPSSVPLAEFDATFALLSERANAVVEWARGAGYIDAIPVADVPADVVADVPVADAPKGKRGNK